MASSSLNTRAAVAVDGILILEPCGRVPRDGY